MNMGTSYRFFTQGMLIACLLMLLAACALPSIERNTATVSLPTGMRNLKPGSLKVSGRASIPVAVDGNPLAAARMSTAIEIPAGKRIVRCQAENLETGKIVAGDVIFEAKAGRQYFTYCRSVDGRVVFSIEDRGYPGVVLGKANDGAEPILSPNAQWNRDSVFVAAYRAANDDRPKLKH